MQTHYLDVLVGLKSCVCYQEESENGINTTEITVAAVSLRSKNKSSSGVELSTDSDMPNETGENDTAFPQRAVGGKVESSQELLWSWDGLREAQEQDPDIGRILALFNDSSVIVIVQGVTSPPTQYRLYGRRFLQVKRPNQQYQSTEGTHRLHN